MTVDQPLDVTLRQVVAAVADDRAAAVGRGVRSSVWGDRDPAAVPTAHADESRSPPATRTALTAGPGPHVRPR